jgi:hypothetical protein
MAAMAAAMRTDLASLQARAQEALIPLMGLHSYYETTHGSVGVTRTQLFEVQGLMAALSSAVQEEVDAHRRDGQGHGQHAGRDGSGIQAPHAAQLGKRMTALQAPLLRFANHLAEVVPRLLQL